jgi:hypothetical protein
MGFFLFFYFFILFCLLHAIESDNLDYTVLQPKFLSRKNIPVALNIIAMKKVWDLRLRVVTRPPLKKCTGYFYFSTNANLIPCLASSVAVTKVEASTKGKRVADDGDSSGSDVYLEDQVTR